MLWKLLCYLNHDIQQQIGFDIASDIYYMFPHDWLNEKHAVFYRRKLKNNDLLEIVTLHTQGLIVCHSKTRQCLLTAIKSLHYNKLD